MRFMMVSGGVVRGAVALPAVTRCVVLGQPRTRLHQDTDSMARNASGYTPRGATLLYMRRLIVRRCVSDSAPECVRPKSGWISLGMHTPAVKCFKPTTQCGGCSLIL